MSSRTARRPPDRAIHRFSPGLESLRELVGEAADGRSQDVTIGVAVTALDHDLGTGRLVEHDHDPAGHPRAVVL